MFIISHLSLPTQLGQKKVFTQSIIQWKTMILIFDRDHISTVQGLRITKVLQSFQSILLSIILKIKQMPWLPMSLPAGLANNYLFLEIRTATQGCLVDCGKKEDRGCSGGWLERWLERWLSLQHSFLPKIYNNSSPNHNFQCIPLFQIITYKHSACTAKFDSQALVLEGWKVHFHCTGHQH